MRRKTIDNIRLLTDSKTKRLYPEEALSSYARVNGLTKEQAIKVINTERKVRGLKEAYPEFSFSTPERRNIVIPSKLEGERLNILINAKSKDIIPLKNETSLREATIQATYASLAKKGYDLREERKKLQRMAKK